METTRRRSARAALMLAAAITAAPVHAHEILYLSEGRVYRGEVRGERPHGEGRMLWPSGAIYAGQWAHGARHAMGTHRDREGVV